MLLNFFDDSGCDLILFTLEVRVSGGCESGGGK